jgi:hypothetical protein
MNSKTCVASHMTTNVLKYISFIYVNLESVVHENIVLKQKKLGYDRNSIFSEKSKQ